MLVVHRLAPMSPLIRVITAFVLALPVVMVVLGQRAEPVGTPLTTVGLGLIALYLGVWLWMRPSRFELGPSSLTIVWPLRRRPIDLAHVVSTEVIERTQFHERYGRSVRVGVGGLWGQFGWAWTSRAGLVDTYISTLGPFVLIERSNDRPLLITPEDPRGFVEHLGF